MTKNGAWSWARRAAKGRPYARASPSPQGRPAAARRTDTEPLFCVGRDIVLAKSASLCFRLTAKTRSAPLLVLSPRDPLRWARAGPLICAPNHVVPHTEKHHTPSPVILRPLGRRIRTPVLGSLSEGAVTEGD